MMKSRGFGKARKHDRILIINVFSDMFGFTGKNVFFSAFSYNSKTYPLNVGL